MNAYATTTYISETTELRVQLLNKYFLDTWYLLVWEKQWRKYNKEKVKKIRVSCFKLLYFLKNTRLNSTKSNSCISSSQADKWKYKARDFNLFSHMEGPLPCFSILEMLTNGWWLICKKYIVTCEKCINIHERTLKLVKNVH